MIFGISLEDTSLVKRFVKDTNKRLDGSDMIKNPFTDGWAKGWDTGHDFVAVFNLAPVYPNTAWIGLITFFGIYILKGTFAFTWWYLVPIFFCLPIIIRNKIFYSFVMFLGLRKEGYRGKYKLLTNQKLLTEVYIKWLSKTF